MGNLGIPGLRQYRQTCRCPHTCTCTTMKHADFVQGNWTCGWSLLTCDVNFQWHLSVTVNNTKHIQRQAPCWSPRCKTCEMSSFAANQCQHLKDHKGSESAAVNTQAPDTRLSHQQLNKTPCLSSWFSNTRSLPSPPYAHQLVYYISPTQRKWTLFPSTSKTWAAPRHSDVQTDRPVRQQGT